MAGFCRVAQADRDRQPPFRRVFLSPSVTPSLSISSAPPNVFDAVTNRRPPIGESRTRGDSSRCSGRRACRQRPSNRQRLWKALADTTRAAGDGLDRMRLAQGARNNCSTTCDGFLRARGCDSQRRSPPDERRAKFLPRHDPDPGPRTTASRFFFNLRAKCVTAEGIFSGQGVFARSDRRRSMARRDSIEARRRASHSRPAAGTGDVRRAGSFRGPRP